MSLGKHPKTPAMVLAIAASCFLAIETAAQEASGGASSQQQWFDAALVGDVAAMASAADAGVNIDVKDASGATALITAALSGDSEVVRFLLLRGANTDSRAATGATPLMVAAWQGHLESVQLLLGAGSDANAATVSNGATALIFAAQEGHLDVVDTLLEAGAEVDAQAGNGTTALMAAIKEGHVDTVRRLLSAGANISLQKRDGASAMTVAASTGQDAISGLLAYFVANDRLPPVQETAPPSSANLGASLIASARIGDELGVLKLLDRDAPINHRSDANETALIVAAEGAYGSILEELLRAGSDLEVARTTDGATALAVAAGAGHVEVVRALLDAGSQIDAHAGNTDFSEQETSEAWIRKTSQKTPLMLAISNGHNDVAVLLLERGADPNPRDEKGRTALSIAVEAEDFALAELLLEKGADVNSLSTDQTVALKTAQGVFVAASPPKANAEPVEEIVAKPTPTEKDESAKATDVALRPAPEEEPVPKLPEAENPLQNAVSTPDTARVDQPPASDPSVPAAEFDPDSPEIIRRIQAMLNEAGFNAGPADGLIGNRTRSAIRKYEDEIGLESTGEISEKVFQRLQKETSG